MLVGAKSRRSHNLERSYWHFESKRKPQARSWWNSQHTKVSISENSIFNIARNISNAGLHWKRRRTRFYRRWPFWTVMSLTHFFIEDLGNRGIGGCQGHAQQDIEQMARNCQRFKAESRQPSSVHSRNLWHPACRSDNFQIVGERLNASGSKKCRDLLMPEDWTDWNKYLWQGRGSEGAILSLMSTSITWTRRRRICSTGVSVPFGK